MLKSLVICYAYSGAATKVPVGPTAIAGQLANEVPRVVAAGAVILKVSIKAERTAYTQYLDAIGLPGTGSFRGLESS